MNRKDRLIVFLAEGFGSGKTPISPGTAGSVVGLAWFWILAQFNSLPWFISLSILSCCASVYLCGQAEQVFKRRDPGNIVIDEIIAVPMCYLAWMISIHYKYGSIDAALLFNQSGWIPILVGFGLFRLFDIWKPWPIKGSQNLAGGWGVTMDDLLAALYVNVVMLPFLL